jgi:hypothetical protein
LQIKIRPTTLSCVPRRSRHTSRTILFHDPSLFSPAFNLLCYSIHPLRCGDELTDPLLSSQSFLPPSPSPSLKWFYNNPSSTVLFFFGVVISDFFCPRLFLLGASLLSLGRLDRLGDSPTGGVVLRRGRGREPRRKCWCESPRASVRRLAKRCVKSSINLGKRGKTTTTKVVSSAPYEVFRDTVRDHGGAAQHDGVLVVRPHEPLAGHVFRRQHSGRRASDAVAPRNVNSAFFNFFWQNG